MKSELFASIRASIFATFAAILLFYGAILALKLSMMMAPMLKNVLMLLLMVVATLPNVLVLFVIYIIIPIGSVLSPAYFACKVLFGLDILNWTGDKVKNLIKQRKEKKSKLGRTNKEQSKPIVTT